LDELMPFVEAEVARVKRVEDAIEQGVLVRRRLDDPEYPAGAEVIDPLASRAPWQVMGADGSIVDTGAYWGCAYCPWRSRCGQDGTSETLNGGNND
jgi:hypothetical protein